MRVQYIGECLVHRGAQYIRGYNEYIGGYHEYIGGGVLSTSKGYHDACGGYHEYTGGCSVH